MKTLLEMIEQVPLCEVYINSYDIQLVFTYEVRNQDDSLSSLKILIPGGIASDGIVIEGITYQIYAGDAQIVKVENLLDFPNVVPTEEGVDVILPNANNEFEVLNCPNLSYGSLLDQTKGMTNQLIDNISKVLNRTTKLAKENLVEIQYIYYDATFISLLIEKTKNKDFGSSTRIRTI